MHDHSTNPRHSLPIPSALLPPSIHKPLKPQHPSSLVSIPGLKLPAPPRLAPHHATPFFPWIQKLSCLPPSPLKAPLQAPLSSFPILPSWASCTPPINLDHACLLRSHFLLDPSTALTPESLASSSHPSALPLNQWTTIDGPFTSDRDDAIKITPSSTHPASSKSPNPTQLLAPLCPTTQNTATHSGTSWTPQTSLPPSSSNSLSAYKPHPPPTQTPSGIP